MHSTQQVMLISHPGIVRIASSLSVTLQPRLREARIISTVLDVEIVIYIVRVLHKFHYQYASVNTSDGNSEDRIKCAFVSF